MKLSRLLCAAFVSFAALAPVTASAGHESCGQTRVTYDRCGQPVYWTYTFVGRDRCGNPVFQWVQQCRGGNSGYQGRDYGYNRGGYDRGGYGRDSYYDRGGDRCDSGRSRSGVSFYWSR